MRSTLFIFLLFLSACNPAPQPSAAHKLTPASISHADFSPSGQLSIGLREQVAIYDKRGEMLQLIEMGEAQGSWQPVWVAPQLLAIADNHTVFLWHTREADFSGSWAFQQAPFRVHAGASGKLLTGDADGGLHLFVFTSDGALDEYRQPHAHQARISAVQLSQNGQQAASASDDGQLQMWSLAEQRVTWQWSASAEQQITHITLSTDSASLYAATAQRGRLLSTSDGQAIVHLDANKGTIHERFEFAAQSRISSMRASDFGLLIGGSSNQWWLMQEGVIHATRKYPQGSPFGQDAGTVLTLYNSQDSLYAATSSGYLQIWLKQDIVNESTK